MTSTSPARTILIVDDTPDNIALLSALLRDSYRLKVANNGEKALQIASSTPTPDLILLDVMMPDLDGYETCRRLKADVATASIPVIFLTAKAHPDDAKKGLSLGAVAYITKPINPADVLGCVAQHIAPP